jgi:mxaL protein
MSSSKTIRVWLWLLALGLLAATGFKPTWTLPQSTYRYLIVFDITQSMNARDYHLAGLPPDRLSFAKAAIEAAIFALPCGAQVGLGVFTHKDTQPVLEPIEVCGHASALRTVLEGIDWRSAWAADSYIAYGLFDAWRLAKALNADLVFLTDGDQFPDTAQDPPFQGRKGEVNGWLVGVGTPYPVPIPKLDLDGRQLGYFTAEDLPQFRLSTPQPAALLLSRLDTDRLHRLASETGLAYLPLTTPKQLTEAMRQPNLKRVQKVATDLRPWLGLGALLLSLGAILV